MRSLARRSRRSRDDRGASAVEYGLMVAAIAAVIVAVVFGLGSVVKGTFSHTQECIEKLQGGPNCSTP